MSIERIQELTAIELYRLTNAMMREAQNHLDRINSDEDNLSCINGWILRYLYNNRDRDVFQRDIEREFSITRSTASKIVRLMERKGLIESGSVPNDARLKTLKNTDKAKQYRGIMRQEMNYLEGKMLKNFSDEEKKQLNQFIRRMHENLSK